MKTITVLTATRAEYGLLRPIIKALDECPEFCVKVVVTGAHLSPEFGLTYKEIENDGSIIDKKIEILLSADTPSAISKSMGLAMMGFADYFAEDRPDALLVLGDRYETLAVCCVAMNERIPIIHLYGGETTEGAVDEAIRHAITKLSFLHLTSTEEYRKRVIQLGENPCRVFTVGAIGVENVLKQPLLTKQELEQSLECSLQRPYAVVTFHPVTLENCSAKDQCEQLLLALDEISDMDFIITKANADADGRVINDLLEKFAKQHDNVMLYSSLGVIRYLSAVKYADMVIGNSSSGLVEVPSFHIPTVNIGERQKGRLRASSVIDCEPRKSEICKAVNKAKRKEMQELAANVMNPYGDGDTTGKIVAAIQKMFRDGINLKKKFYDIEGIEKADAITAVCEIDHSLL